MSSIRGWVRSPESIMDDWVDACRGASEDNPGILVEEFKLDDRVLRLFACELCRSIWDNLDSPCKESVLVAERFADGEASIAQLHAASIVAANVWESYLEDEVGPGRVGEYAADAAYGATMHGQSALYALSHVACCMVRAIRCGRDRKFKVTTLRQGKSLASMVGLGWKFDPEWRTSTAVQLASHIYGKREWGTLPILADALQDAGCDESVLLKELRSGKAVWCRGCRILDEILGRR